MHHKHKNRLLAGSISLRLPVAIAAVVVFLLPVARACSVCGCSLSSDWGLQGYTTKSGWDADLRFEYFEQSRLYSGASTVNRTLLEIPNDEEIQQRTVNRNVWLNLDYNPKSFWGVSVQAPYHNRYHTTIASDDTDISTSYATGLGDIRLLARYVIPASKGKLGFQFGLKLPTGRFDQNFASGPQADAPLDRGLQLGTGTTDIIAGVSFFGREGLKLGYFAQATAQKPLTERDGFSPSPTLTTSIGIRYLNTTRLLPQIQINVKWDGRESGVNSDRNNSGGFVAFLSPGLSADVTDDISTYAFVQIPIYQRVSGLQLEPRWLLSFGIRARL